MCRLSWNLWASNSWNPQGLSRPVMGLLLFLLLYIYCFALNGQVTFLIIKQTAINNCIPLEDKPQTPTHMTFLFRIIWSGNSGQIVCDTWCIEGSRFLGFMFLWPWIMSKTWRRNTNKMQQYRWFIVNYRCWLLTNVSTCFEHFYAHHQEKIPRVTAYGVFCW